MKIINVEIGSDAWLLWRRSGVGASDIAAIMGVCPYKTAKDIYEDKMGLSTNKRNGAMQRGIDYEEEARDVFTQSRKNIARDEVSEEHKESDFVGGVYNPLMIEHDDNSMFKASLDGYNFFNRCIVEIKIPSRKVLDQARLGQVPIHYMYQIQWQLYVSGSPKAFYFCYNPDTLEAYTVEVYPDDTMIDAILEKVNKFIEYCQAGIPPEDKKTPKRLDESLEESINKMSTIREQMKELDLQYQVLLEKVLEASGRDQSLECDGYTLTRAERASIDYKTAATDAKIDLEKYIKPVTISWTIRRKDRG